jgi:hypothetical protein
VGVVLGVLAILLAASGQWICPARFAPLPPGWVQGNLGGATTSGTTDSWAHTPGFENLNDIPRDGVYAWVLLSPAPSWRRPLRVPLNLRHPDEIASQEGSTLPEYRFAGRYRRLYYVDLRVDFGRHPTRSTLRRSQILIGRLRLPPRLVSGPRRC